jgi:hypothetical protein
VAGSPARKQPGRVEEMLKVEGRCGDRGYWSQAQSMLADIRRITPGVEVAVRVSHGSGPEGDAPVQVEHAVTFNFQGWTESDLRAALAWSERLAGAARPAPASNGHAPAHANGAPAGAGGPHDDDLDAG